MTSPFLELFNLSFSWIWPGSLWLQLFQMACCFFELLVVCSFYQFSSIVTNACWWDSTPHKQQEQVLLCFTFGCHWESSCPSKVWDIHLCTLVALSGHCTGKHHIWEYRMCQAMTTKILIIGSELSWQQGVELSPDPSLSCELDSLLSFLSDYAPSLGQDFQVYW